MLLQGSVGPWEVIVADVRETISEPTFARVRLRLEASDTPPDEESLGKKCVLELQEDGTAVRAWHLVVRSVIDEGADDQGRIFELELDDRFGLLDLRTDMRIFQELDAKEIATKVFEGAGIEAASIEWKLQRTLPKRTYCVQHRETDRAFVERVLRHEGIFRIPADDPDAAKAIFADGPNVFTAIEGESTQPLLDSGGGIGVRELEVEHSVVSDEIVLRDWNYETPAVDLTATGRVRGEVASSLYEFPGGYQTPAVGDALAKIRAEELAAGIAVANGASHVIAFRPGRWFQLDVAREPLAIKWLLREVRHHFARLQTAIYRNEFVASPFDQPYRPARDARRPTVTGSHSVRVTGPSGEIHTDSLGRMKAKFFWDRVGKEDDKATCWMRVLQLPIGGSQALARIGWEMIVRYAWGDPDRPIAVARADNGTHPAPYAYPKAASAMAFKTLSSPGGAKFNEFAMEDGGGSMEFRITAAKDWNEQVNHDETEKITANEKFEIGTDLSTTIGANQTIDIGAMNSVTIGADAGVNITGDRTKTVGAAETVTITGNLAEKITGSDSETVGASHTSLATMGVGRTSKGSHSLTVGGSMIQAAALGCSIAVAGSKSETIGGAKLVVSGGAISETMIGAMAITVGGAVIHTAGGNRMATAKGSSNLTVGGVAMLNAGSKLQMKAPKIKMTVAGVANFLGGGGILNVTPASISFVGLITVKGSTAIKVAGAPNLVG
jgi:type VI secretion system secreted protein VgrG